MIKIAPGVSLDDSELRFDFVRSSGPGGQNVNKLSTTAQLRFDVIGSPNLNKALKERLVKLAGRRMTSEGVLIIQAGSYRSQEKNREDALRRLSQLIRKASHVPRQRKKTKPTLASKAKRLETKKRRSKVKQMRKPVLSSDD